MAALLKRINESLVVLAMGLSFHGSAAADAPLRFDLYDGRGGATCEYFNKDAQVKWKHRQGDWVDAVGAARGTAPFTATTVGSDSTRATWDVTRMFRTSSSAPARNQLTLLLKVLDDSSASRAYFASREAPNTRQHPRLSITDSEGNSYTLPPLADTMLQCSTARSLGAAGRLTIAANSYALLQFDLTPVATSHFVRAELELVPIEILDGPVNIGIFQMEPPHAATRPPNVNGISARYSNDFEIQSDHDVIMATGFDEDDWRTVWGQQSIRGLFEVVDSSRGNDFAPLYGHALQVTIPKGENLGLDLSFSFKGQTGSEPEELYFRYYLRLASTWAPNIDGGKLPGISGTYGISGWGGRKADGSTGWSMRGMFHRQPESDNPLSALTPIGTYAYHADMQDIWGDSWPWTDDAVGLLERNRWYCIEQFVRLNVPGNRDGVLRTWIDGVLAFERTDIRYRDTPRLRIEKVWMNVYHGGKATPTSDLRLFIDNVVIARRYIGPMVKVR